MPETTQTCSKCGMPGAVLHFPGGYLCPGGCQPLPFETSGGTHPPPMTPNSGPSIEPLRECPFCGGDAESDLSRGFVDYKGQPGNAVAIYCLKCNCDMCMCYGDFPQYSPEDMLTILKEAWNLRAPAHAALKKAKVAFETFNKPLYQPGAHQHDIVNEIRSRDQLFSDALTAIKECGL